MLKCSAILKHSPHKYCPINSTHLSLVNTRYTNDLIPETTRHPINLPSQSSNRVQRRRSTLGGPRSACSLLLLLIACGVNV